MSLYPGLHTLEGPSFSLFPSDSLPQGARSPQGQRECLPKEYVIPNPMYVDHTQEYLTHPQPHLI